MDPLSITVSAFTIVAVVNRIAKCIKTIKDIHNTPQELSAIVGELDELSSIVAQAAAVIEIRNADSCGGEKDTSTKMLGRCIDAVMAKVENVSAVLEGHFVVNSPLGHHNLRAMHMHLKWVRGRERAIVLLDELKTSRLNLAICLTALVAYVLPFYG
jgi:hypothetical protein